MWQRRFCCAVPHTFLYYFEDEEADTPRGIIDLEYYTQITHDNRIIAISPMEGVPLRTFYFQLDTDEEVNAWMSTLTRDRFEKVREERDAYQELQTDFQHQQEMVAQMMEEAQREGEIAKAALTKVRQPHSSQQFSCSSAPNRFASTGTMISFSPRRHISTTTTLPPNCGRSSPSRAQMLQFHQRISRIAMRLEFTFLHRRACSSAPVAGVGPSRAPCKFHSAADLRENGGRE